MRPGAPEPILGGTRPPVIGSSAGVSAGHPLTSAAGIEILQRGGNAFDAGVAAVLVGGVVEQDLFSLGGETLVLVYPVKEKRVTSVVGQGWAPKGASIEWYQSRGKTLDGEGLDPSVVPGSLHGALTVLERWGTMSFEQVSARAIAYAEQGFPMRPRTAETITRNLEFFKKWPDNERYWLKPDGSMYLPGETIKLPTLANTLKKMVDAERKARRKGRAAAVVAARDRFYKGDIAESMVAFLKKHEAPYDRSDFAEFFATVEPADVHHLQGLHRLQTGIRQPGPLAAADAEHPRELRPAGHGPQQPGLHPHPHRGDEAVLRRPRYLLWRTRNSCRLPAKGCCRRRTPKSAPRRSIRTARRARSSPGIPLPFDSQVKDWPFWVAHASADTVTSLTPMPLLLADAGIPKDTTHMSVIDKDGNMFDTTSSGGWISGAVILGDTGIAMSVRGEQFWLDETHANHLRPRSRPRYTLTPSLVLKDDKPFMALGTPGGDNQEQTILQAFLDIVEFWEDWYPNLHTAFAWPRVQTMHFYGSVTPHRAGFNRMNIEEPISKAVFDELKSRGHEIEQLRQYGVSGCATAVLIDPATGNRMAGADPRRDCYAMAY